MNVGGGEAADQLVRMMLSGSEVAVRLGGSALKNLLAITLALAENNRAISGKVNMTRMLKETRDVRVFPMSRSQYKEFQRRAKKQKILFAVIKDKDGNGEVMDVVMPVTELDRANQISERILYQMPAKQAPGKEKTAEKGREEAVPPKKDSRSQRDSPDTRTSSSTPRTSGTEKETSDRPSVLGRLQGYRDRLDQQEKSAPAREKTRAKSRQR